MTFLISAEPTSQGVSRKTFCQPRQTSGIESRCKGGSGRLGKVMLMV